MDPFTPPGGIGRKLGSPDDADAPGMADTVDGGYGMDCVMAYGWLLNDDGGSMLPWVCAGDMVE